MASRAVSSTPFSIALLHREPVEMSPLSNQVFSGWVAVKWASNVFTTRGSFSSSIFVCLRKIVTGGASSFSVRGRSRRISR
ncbi:hypothetical protein WMF12_42865 [Sorangium sp. So ce363]